MATGVRAESVFSISAEPAASFITNRAYTAEAVLTQELATADVFFRYMKSDQGI